MKTFRDIIAWQKGYQLTLKLYGLTAAFPACEEFGLKSQIRRASVSVISNIAEGFKRLSRKEQLYFYKVAQGSLEELTCQTILSKDLGYFNDEAFKDTEKMIDEAGKVLNGWIKCHQQ